MEIKTAAESGRFFFLFLRESRDSGKLHRLTTLCYS